MANSTATVSAETLNLIKEIERRQKVKQQRERILDLHHACYCRAPAGTCKAISACDTMKMLWAHVKKCNDMDCTFDRCISSRYALVHYHQCKDMDCEICAPILKMRVKNR